MTFSSSQFEDFQAFTLDQESCAVWPYRWAPHLKYLHPSLDVCPEERPRRDLLFGWMHPATNRGPFSRLGGS